MSNKFVKTKVVASRFKEAAERISSDTSNSSGNGLKLKRSNSVKESRSSRLDIQRKRQQQFSKTICVNKNLAKVNTNSESREESSIAAKAKQNLVQKANLQRTKYNSSNDGASNISPNYISNKMHSTAVNATLLNTTAAPSCMNAMSSLELPDISAIKLEPSEFTPPQPPSYPKTSTALIETEYQGEENYEFDVTEENLEVAHLNYLTWCNLAAMAETSHAHSMDPVKKELCFLEEITRQKQIEKSDLKQKLHLLTILNDSLATQDLLLSKLEKMNDGTSKWVHNLQKLAHTLEYHLHQYAMSSAILPETKEELIELLSTISDVGKELLSKLPDLNEEVATANSLLEDADELKRCCRTMHDAACYALQKCSRAIAH